MSAMPQLDFLTYPSQLFWFLISFVGVYLVSKKLIIPRIESVIQKRFSKMRDQIDCAQSFCSLSKEVINNRARDIEDARVKANTIVSMAKKKTVEMQHNLQIVAEEEVSALMRLADEKIEALKNEQRDNYKKFAVEISSMYVSKILGSDVTNSKAAKILVDKLFEEEESL